MAYLTPPLKKIFVGIGMLSLSASFLLLQACSNSGTDQPKMLTNSLKVQDNLGYLSSQGLTAGNGSGSNLTLSFDPKDTDCSLPQTQLHYGDPAVTATMKGTASHTCHLLLTPAYVDKTPCSLPITQSGDNGQVDLTSDAIKNLNVCLKNDDAKADFSNGELTLTSTTKYTFDITNDLYLPTSNSEVTFSSKGLTDPCLVNDVIIKPGETTSLPFNNSFINASTCNLKYIIGNSPRATQNTQQVSFTEDGKSSDDFSNVNLTGSINTDSQQEILKGHVDTLDNNIMALTFSSKATTRLSLKGSPGWYPMETLEWQADSWLTQKLSTTQSSLLPGLVPDMTCGPLCITSKSIGFQMIISAAMMKLEERHQDMDKYSTYKTDFETAYTFVNKRLVNGLLPSQFDKGAATGTQQASSTDADFYIAIAEDIAAQAEHAKAQDDKANTPTKASDDDSASDLIGKARAMMGAIYQLDTTTLDNGTATYTFLNNGGCNRTGIANCKLPTSRDATYTKSILWGMYLFSKHDAYRIGKVHNHENWVKLIQNTLDIMKNTQGLLPLNQGWKQTLGANPDAPGDIYIGTDFKPVLPQNDWVFNQDALQVPMELGGYSLMRAQDKSNEYPKAEAATILTNEMDGIDSAVISSDRSQQNTVDDGLYIYLKGIYTAPTTPNSPYPADDAVAGNLLLGQLGLIQQGDQHDPAPAKFLEDKINTTFSSCIGLPPFYKLLNAFFINGVFIDRAVPLPLDIKESNYNTVPAEAPFLPIGIDTTNSDVTFGVGFNQTTGPGTLKVTIAGKDTAGKDVTATWSDPQPNPFFKTAPAAERGDPILPESSKQVMYVGFKVGTGTNDAKKPYGQLKIDGDISKMTLKNITFINGLANKK